ncbi:hypothetical protein ONS95_013281 [Cadophora gregata]|uniref:uncharacterized protein n=1 Tax=Cadophora gregata TaxID=51156 RepID=UPI0026DB3C9B|nr:uncharacterized protein ONS95_013281 [Cadophora gregata]KAK0116255.1 hypothetical protein ONS95_013281 [Cadophora gregata]
MSGPSGKESPHYDENIPPKLCEFCQDTIDHCPEIGGYLEKLKFKHYPTSHALAASATAGCILCIHLIQSERDGDEWDDTTELQAGTAILETTRGARPSGDDDFGDSRIILSILRPGKHAIISMLPTLLSPAIHNHPPLKIASTESNLPLNIAEVQESVPVQALTKTFQDAIRITSYLGLEDLWIDSLCIIQDDINDWNRQLSLMSDVYGGSTINIAASSAPDRSYGCTSTDIYFGGILFKASTMVVNYQLAITNVFLMTLKNIS